jgi:hypothetical protein
MFKKDICRYFLKSTCNKGDTCSYEHITDNLHSTKDSDNTIKKTTNKRVPNKNPLKYSKEGRAQIKIQKKKRESNLLENANLSNKNSTKNLSNNEHLYRNNIKNNFQEIKEHQPFIINDTSKIQKPNQLIIHIPVVVNGHK